MLWNLSILHWRMCVSRPVITSILRGLSPGNMLTTSAGSFPHRYKLRRTRRRRWLFLEALEERQLLAADLGDAFTLSHID